MCTTPIREREKQETPASELAGVSCQAIRDSGGVGLVLPAHGCQASISPQGLHVSRYDLSISGISGRHSFAQREYLLKM